MGAWGEGPMSNDTALDWMASRIEAPLAAMIQDTLQGYLDGTMHPSEAEAAVALLIDLTSGVTGTKYRGIDLGHESAERGLWDLAIQAVERAKTDTAWITSWIDPRAKLGIL